MAELKTSAKGSLPASSLKYVTLEHWRGVAALSVLFFHSFGNVRLAGLAVHPSISWLKWLSDFGWFGVHLFFVISGYCIAANIWRLAQKEAGPWNFLRDRLLRIYPCYWAACLFALVLALGSLPFNHTLLAHNLPAGPVAAVANILLLEPYVGVSSFLLVSWSLVYELGFYFILAAGFGLYRMGVRPVWLLLAAISLGFLGLWGPWRGALYVLNFWPEFLTGGIVFLALYFKTRRVSAGRLLLLVPLAFLVAGKFALPSGEHFEQMVGAALFGWVLYALHPFDVRISQWRALAWLGWVGTFSYSLYLVHVPLGRVINLGTRWVPPGSPWFVCLVVVDWLVAIAGGWTFYRLCEQPLEAWRHQMRAANPVRKSPKAAVPLASLRD